MTKDEAKGYCAYIIAKLGVRTDDERLSVIGEIGLILNGLMLKILTTIRFIQI